jgi:PPP family 3-phenylpropionic acid transporter
MAIYPHKNTAEDFALRLALFYVALFLTVGAQLPLLPVWFAAKGLDPGVIGIVLAVPMVVRVFAIPTAALLADRRDALRAGIMIAAGASLAGFGALGLADGLLAIIVVFGLASAAYTPLMLLADAYALRGLAQRGRAYGPVRLWGSAAFIAASFGGGYLLDAVEARNLIWAIVAAMGVAAVASWPLGPLHPSPLRPAAAAASARWLLRAPAFLAFAGAASLIQASHAVYYGFSTIHWQAGGLDGVTIGILWAIGVLAEIALFGLQARLPATITPAVMLSVGAVGAVIRWSAMALDPPVVVLPVVQCLHIVVWGNSFGHAYRSRPDCAPRTRNHGARLHFGDVRCRHGCGDGIVRSPLRTLWCRCLRRHGDHRARRRPTGAGGAPELRNDYRQIGYIEASSRPARNIIR